MPRIAYLSYSTGEFDGRTHRMARTALEAGYDVVVYARWQRDLPLEEERATALGRMAAELGLPRQEYAFLETAAEP